MKKLFQNFHCWYFWSRKILSRGATSRDLWKWVSWEKSGRICTYICIGTEPVHFVTLTQKRIKKCQWIMIEIQDAVETIILVITVVTLNEDFFLSNLPAVTKWIISIHFNIKFNYIWAFSRSTVTDGLPSS